jgi:hypothetical protein
MHRRYGRQQLSVKSAYEPYLLATTCRTSLLDLFSFDGQSSTGGVDLDKLDPPFRGHVWGSTKGGVRSCATTRREECVNAAESVHQSLCGDTLSVTALKGFILVVSLAGRVISACLDLP